MATKRKSVGPELPLAYDENYVDLTDGSNGAPLPETSPSNSVGGNGAANRAYLQQILASETQALAQKYTIDYWRARGCGMADAETLVSAYGKREPAARILLLTALRMEPRHMAHLFTIARKRPDLPSDDPVFKQLCATDKSVEEERIAQNRMLNLSTIEVDPITWPRIINKCFGKGIETLGDLADASPSQLSVVKGFGILQLRLCAQVLKTHDLLNDQWRAKLES